MSNHAPHKPHHRPDDSEEPAPARKPIDPDQGGIPPVISEDPEQEGVVDSEV